jgi:hypothetical protein
MSRDAAALRTEDSGGQAPTCDGGLPLEAPIDGGLPPPECVAPCVWNLVKHCLPKTACEPPNAHRRVEFLRVGLAGVFTVYVDDKICYQYGERISPVGFHANWLDGDGNVVAWHNSLISPSVGWSCGPFPPCLPNCTAPDAAASTQPSYSNDLANPKCAPWRGLTGPE